MWLFCHQVRKFVKLKGILIYVHFSQNVNKLSRIFRLLILNRYPKLCILIFPPKINIKLSMTVILSVFGVKVQSEEVNETFLMIIMHSLYYAHCSVENYKIHGFSKCINAKQMSTHLTTTLVIKPFNNSHVVILTYFA